MPCNDPVGHYGLHQVQPASTIQFGQATGPLPAPRGIGIYEEMDCLDKGLCCLAEQVAKLSEVLKPVLAPEPPATCGELRPHQHEERAPLAIRLAGYRAQVDSLARQLSAVADRLAL